MCSTHSSLTSADADVATKGIVTIGVSIGVKHVYADWSNSNYPAKAKFRIEITKAWARRNAWAPTRSFGRDQINRSRVNTSLLYYVLVNTSIHFKPTQKLWQHSKPQKVWLNLS